MHPLKPPIPFEPFRALHQKYARYTMVMEDVFISNLRIVQACAAAPGSVVECGTWRGGMIAAIAEVLGPQRRYHLYDSFEGLPPAKDIDGPAALAWQADKTGPHYHDNCTATEESAREAMRLSGAKDVHIVKGWFDRTVPKFSDPEGIAILRIDGDWYDSTLVCLENLYDRVVFGGVVLIDDYYVWDGCSKAVHDFLSKRKSAARIQQGVGVAFIRKTER